MMSNTHSMPSTVICLRWKKTNNVVSHNVDERFLLACDGIAYVGVFERRV
jgi:hypothetical protein